MVCESAIDSIAIPTNDEVDDLLTMSGDARHDRIIFILLEITRTPIPNISIYAPNGPPPSETRYTTPLASISERAKLHNISIRTELGKNGLLKQKKRPSGAFSADQTPYLIQAPSRSLRRGFIN